MIHLLIAFLKRDMRIWTSYRLAFIWEFLTLIGGTFVLFYIGRAIDAGASVQLARYGGSYFEFILVGVGFLNYVGAVTGSLNSAVRDGQQTGTLEVILVSPHRLPAILIGSSGSFHTMGLLRFTTYFLLGRFVFGLWGNANYGGVLLMFLLAAVCFSAISLMGSAFTVAFKKGNPVLGIYNILSIALGGLLFPVALLPEWLQNFSYLLPLTHALEGMRLALNGYSLAEMSTPIVALAAFTLILMPLGAAAFVWGVNLAKDHGSLVHY